MSKTIDERIVQMRFDNADFEKNISQSRKTLSEFDSALTSSLNGNRFNLSKIADVSSSLGGIIGIGSAVENVSTKFSALQTIGVGALLKIGEQAAVLSEKLVKDLTLDQVTAGFTKYADKTTSVQTIMSATADQFEDQGKQMEFVSAQLEKLNWFTDETSYNFVDMTNNIGKFTSQGIELEKSVTAMEGISVWAAQSGQNAEAASRAMYNLSQALGAGAVKLQDWKSIENANMATKEFKEIAIAAGEAAGTIEKGQVTVENFSQSLGDSETKGWFSSEVLMDVLTQYGKFTDVLNEVCNSFENADVTATDMLATLDDYMNGTLDVNATAKEYGTTVEDLTEKLDALGSSEYDLGRKSFKSAQEAKTFEEAIDATKDAVSTAWLNIFETIFGNYLEAKELWTGLANYLYDVFAQPINDLGELLSEWAEDGREPLIEMFSTIGDKLTTIFDAPKKAFEDVFGNISAKKLVEITRKLNDLVKNTKFFTITSKSLYSVSKLVLSVFKLLGKVVKIVGTTMKPVVSIFGSLIEKLSDYADKISSFVVQIADGIKINEAFKKSFSSISKVGDEATNTIIKFGENLINAFKAGSMNGGVMGGFANSITFVMQQFEKLVELTLDYISALTGIDMTEFKNSVVGSIESAIESWKNFCSSVKNWYTEAEGGFSGLANVIYNVLAQVFQKIVDKIEELTGWDLSGFIDTITGALDKAKDKIKEFTDKFNALDEANEKLSVTEVLLTSISDIFKTAISSIAGAFKQLGSALASSPLLVAFAIFSYKDLHDLANGLTEFIKSLTSAKQAGVGIKDFGANIKAGFTSIKEGLTDIAESISTAHIFTIAGSIAMLSLAMLSLASVDSNKIAAVLGALTGAFAELLGVVAIASKIPATGFTDTLGRISRAMLVMSVSVLILAKAMETLNKCDPEGLAYGIGVLVFAFSALVVAVEAISVLLKDTSRKSMGNVSKAVISMLIMAEAVKALTSAIVEISKCDPEGLAYGIGTVVSALFMLVVGIEGISVLVGSIKMSSLAALLVLALSIKMISDTVKSFESVGIETLVKGMLAVAGAMITIVAAMSILGMSSGTALSTSVAMLALAISIKIISDAILDLSEAAQRGDQLSLGFLFFAGALGMLVVALNLIKGPLLEVGAGILLTAVGIRIIASAIKSVIDLNMDQMTNGVMGLGVALAALVVCLNMMKGSIGGAFALLIASGALIALAEALKILADIKFTSLVKAVVMLVPALILLCAAVDAFEFAMAGAAAMLVAGAALTVLAFAIKMIAEVPFIEAVGGLMVLAAAIGGFMLLSPAIMAAAQPMLIAAGVIAGVVAIFAVGIVALSGSLYLLGLSTSASAVGVAAFAESMRLFGNVLKNNGNDLAAAANVIMSLIGPLGAFGLVGITAGAAAAVLGAGFTVLAVGLTLLLVSAKLISTFVDSLQGMTDAFIDFITRTSEVATECSRTAGELVLLGLALSALALSAPLAAAGFALLAPAVILVSAAFTKINADIEKSANGLTKIGDAIGYLAEHGKSAAIEIAAFAVAMAAAAPSLKSSAKDIKPMAEYMTDMTKACKDLSSAFVNLEITAVDALKDVIEELKILLDEGLDTEPVITPVIDMTKFETGMTRMNELVTNTASKINNIAAAAVDTKGNVLTVKVDNTDVVKQLQSVQKDVVSLGNKVNSLKVYLDKNKLVGEIAPAIDKRLGITANRAARFSGSKTVYRKKI